jgi:DNA-binding IclR family transcriptional regulator
MNDNLPPNLVMRQMIFGYVITKSIHVAAKLNIAELITANGPMNTTELASKSGAHEESLYRLLRALASIGIFSEDKTGKFSITPLAEGL